jgi:hypothetical protein
MSPLLALVIGGLALYVVAVVFLARFLRWSTERNRTPIDDLGRDRLGDP